MGIFTFDGLTHVVHAESSPENAVGSHVICHSMYDVVVLHSAEGLWLTAHSK